MHRRTAAVVAGATGLVAIGLGTWWLAFTGTPSPVAIRVYAIPARSAETCRKVLPDWPYACRHARSWYHLDLRAKGTHPVAVECSAVLLDRRGRPIRGVLGAARWGIVLDPRSGPAGGLAREVDPGHEVHVDYPVTPGVPPNVAAYRRPRCHAIPFDAWPR